jgi:hypothetical protein
VSRSGGGQWGASDGHELQTKDYPQMIAALLLAFVLFGCRLVSCWYERFVSKRGLD